VKKHVIVVLLACWSLVFVQTQVAFGAVTTFTDRVAWEAAIGGSPDVIVGFNNVTVDTSFQTVPFDAGEFTLLGGIDQFDYVDVAPFEGGGQWDLDETPYVMAEVFLPNDEFDMTFAQPVTAWGAELSKIDSGGLDLVYTSDLGTSTVSVPDISPAGFFGFVTDPNEAITSIKFVARSGGEAFGMDDVSLELVTGACCDPLGDCEELTANDCADDYQGDGTLCADVTCPRLVPAASEWGLVVTALLGLAVGTVLFARTRRLPA